MVNELKLFFNPIALPPHKSLIDHVNPHYKGVTMTESRYIYGLHDAGGEDLLDGKGWVLVTEQIGRDPNDPIGKDYTAITDKGLTVIVRLNNAYGSHGTIPHSQYYADFAQRCANFVKASKGCQLWIIGNEINMEREQPREHGSDKCQPITPRRYADCFRKVRNRIKKVSHKHNVIMAPIAPWNGETPYDADPYGIYPENKIHLAPLDYPYYGCFGDFIQYMTDTLEAIGRDNLDGIAIHAYTHGYDAKSVTNDVKMGPPFDTYHYHFRIYKDQMQVIPTDFRHLPVYLTEMNGDVNPDGSKWDKSDGWLQAAYHELNQWNQTEGNQQIRCGIIYRWSTDDDWSIAHKPHVHADLKAALQHDYQWQDVPQEAPAVQPVTHLEYSPNIRILFDDGQVESMPLETYLQHVVSAEMPAHAKLEALKAQAIASRTYAIYAMRSHKFRQYGADIHANASRSQAFGDHTHAQAEQAVAETIGQILTYQNKPINAFYHSNCGGQTTAPQDIWSFSTPYLQSVSCAVNTTKKGHGVGMCQHGAMAFAKDEGWSCYDIVSHYYTLTTVHRLDYATNKTQAIAVDRTPFKPLVEFHASPNYDNRAYGEISAIVMHATANDNLEGVINWFGQQRGKDSVSAHYTIGKAGRIVQHVADEKRAWHAGKSFWKGRESLNAWSIGIELVNLNDGRDPYPEAQHQANVQLCAYLCKRYAINPDMIVTHYQISPGRKTDPRGYDMARLIREVKGLL
jgi:hypothetical protein